MVAKKLFSGALSLAMLASGAVVLADTTTTTADATAATVTNALPSDLADASDALKGAATRLGAYGVMEGSSGKFNPADLLTRAQAAKVFVNATGNGRLRGSVKNKFADVDDEDSLTPFVGVANSTGLMIGSKEDGELVFHPEDNLTYGQIATIAIRALGYGASDVSGDSWPYNYMAKAMELGLFDNIEDSVDAEVEVTRGNMALIADKMLSTATKQQQTLLDTVPATVIAANGSEVTNPAYTKLVKTLLGKVSKNFVKTVNGKSVAVSIAKVDGTVTGVAASDPSLAASQVKIGETVYTVPAADLLAKLALTSVVSVYADSKTNTIVSVESATTVAGIGKLDITTNKASKVAGTTWTLEYTDSSNLNQTVTVSNYATVYFNGVKATDTAAAFAKIGSGAKVSLVDSTTPVLDKVYDTIIVNYTEKFLVTADAATDATDFAQRSVKKADTTLGTVTFAGAATKFPEIKKNDVVYVTATPDNATVKLEVVRKTVTGQITSKAADGSKVTIGGVQYSVSGAAGLTVGNDAGTVYFLDKDGAIAGSSAPTAATSELPGGDGDAVYGFVAGAQWAADSWTGVMGGKVKFTKLDGTTVELSTGAVNPTALLNKSAYYKKNADGTTYSITALSTSGVAFNSTKVSANTVFIEQDAVDGTKILSRTSDIDVTKVTGTVLATLDRNNSWKDYYLVVVDRTDIVKPVSSTTFGYVGGYVEDKIVTKKDASTVQVSVYNVFDNGVAKQVMFASDASKVPAVVAAIQAGKAFNSLTVDENGILTAVAPVTITVDSKLLTAIDATRVCFNGVIYSIDTTNVKVYNKKDGAYKVAALGDVVAYDSANDATTKVDLVFDKEPVGGLVPTDAKVIMIVVNK